MTLNFPGSMLQWTGGAFFAALGNVTNLGTLNLAGSSDKGFYEDGTLDNFGTIIQTRHGRPRPAQRQRHPHDAEDRGRRLLPDRVRFRHRQCRLAERLPSINAGTIRKTAGSGTSQLYINGALDQHRHHRGRFRHPLPRRQFCGPGLGKRADRRHLERAGRRHPGVSHRHGHHQQRGQRHPRRQRGDDRRPGRTGRQQRQFQRPRRGQLHHRRRLQQQRQPDRRRHRCTWTAISRRLPAARSASKSAARPRSGQFGQTVVTGTATLAGAFNLALVNGFSPTGGETFGVLSFASNSGGFTTITGLGRDISESLSADRLRSADLRAATRRTWRRRASTVPRPSPPGNRLR